MTIDEQMEQALRRFADKELRFELERRNHKTVQQQLKESRSIHTLRGLHGIVCQLEALMNDDQMTCESNEKSTGMSQRDVFTAIQEAEEYNFDMALNYEFSLTLEVRKLEGSSVQS